MAQSATHNFTISIVVRCVKICVKDFRGSCKEGDEALFVLSLGTPGEIDTPIWREVPVVPKNPKNPEDFTRETLNLLGFTPKPQVTEFPRF